jgi:presenilin-like A22 family membrane protease
MRYLAICLLSLFTLRLGAMPVIAPSTFVESAAAGGASDELLLRAVLGTFVGVVLLVSQLRRRQKSFGLPRALA